jgi:hypothetical protein
MPNRQYREQASLSARSHQLLDFQELVKCCGNRIRFGMTVDTTPFCQQIN